MSSVRRAPPSPWRPGRTVRTTAWSTSFSRPVHRRRRLPTSTDRELEASPRSSEGGTTREMEVSSTMNQALLADSELKKKHATIWAWGDYPRLTVDVISDLGPRLVEYTGIGSGQRVLDVAAGSGNASIPAAALGAEVVASDLTPELLDAGAKRSADLGLALTWE